MEKLVKVCEFLKSVEEEHSIPAHADLFEEWAEDVKEIWNTTEIVDKESEDILDDLLDFRKKVHTHSLINETNIEESNGWEWLLSVKQVEQRSDEWMLEARNILTASEIGALWKGPGTRAALVRKKASPPTSFITQQAVRRDSTNAMDWGVRYEPIVKDLLQKELDISITDLGRIRHRTIDKLGASPDGLITQGPKELLGRLVEIKCPSTRIINDSVPFEYWCQMQLQMEICDRPVCEYVEVKFKEVDVDKVDREKGRFGWITLQANHNTLFHRYIYHSTPEPPQETDDIWINIETYGWYVEIMRRITQKRDSNWFQGIQSDLQKFWDDVQACREGTWQPPESKRKSKQKKEPESKCCIQDDETVNTEIYLEKTISIPED